MQKLIYQHSIECLERNHLIDATPGGSAYGKLRNDWDDKKHKSRVFILPAGSPLAISDIYKNLETNETNFLALFSLPFENCFFEVAGGEELMIWKNADTLQPIEGIVKGLFATENLTTYNGLPRILTIHHRNKPEFYDYYPIEIYPEKHIGVPGWDAFHRLLLSILVYIRNMACFVSDEVVRTKTTNMNGIKKINIIKNIIYIKPKTEKTPTNRMGKLLQYSHRFEVRGHWRKLPLGKIGKDRNGDYKIPGMTWVIPSERGPKNAPLIKKIRVLESNISI